MYNPLQKIIQSSCYIVSKDMRKSSSRKTKKFFIIFLLLLYSYFLFFRREEAGEVDLRRSFHSGSGKPESILVEKLDELN